LSFGSPSDSSSDSRLTYLKSGFEPPKVAGLIWISNFDASWTANSGHFSR
uniref:Endostatin domain-containing protein n=1 Tax=Haemonchus placei TaxID=6290 RepID=A0A0N4W0W4_HAEPC